MDKLSRDHVASVRLYLLHITVLAEWQNLHWDAYFFYCITFHDENHREGAALCATNSDWEMRNKGMRNFFEQLLFWYFFLKNKYLIHFMKIKVVKQSPASTFAHFYWASFLFFFNFVQNQTFFIKRTANKMEYLVHTHELWKMENAWMKMAFCNEQEQSAIQWHYSFKQCRIASFFSYFVGILFLTWRHFKLARFPFWIAVDTLLPFFC